MARVVNKQHSAARSGGFEPVDLWKSKYLSSRRRNLPHLAVPGATYFVTFRTRPDAKLQAKDRDLVIADILECDQETIDLDAAVVMPDHIHLIFRLMAPHDLGRVLQRIKGRSARQINQMVNSAGSVWSGESFDHTIRHAAEFKEKLEYYQTNPVKRGLADHPHRYEWLFIKSITG
jgi:REP element-mobilizing transposase RayT